MDISPVFFYLFAGLAIGFALMVVLKSHPVANAFALIMVFFAFAGIYALMDAHLIAALQVLVYAGAIMVLFIFVIMLLNADEPSFDMGRTHIGMKVGASILSFALFAAFVWAFKNSPVDPALVAKGTFTPEKIQAAGGNTRVISQLMFSEYILPFELTSVLLLAGIVGAVAMSKRKLGQQKGALQ